MPLRGKVGDKGVLLNLFHVYEHWRPDTGVCFYVGKGKRKRANSFGRNSHHDRIVAKLKRLGLRPEVRIIHSVGTNAEASALEIERIAFWRAAGIAIANYINGGDGTTGHVHSLEARAKIRKKALGRKPSAETRAKMGASRRGLKRTAETRAKMSASAAVAQKVRFEKEKATAEGRARLSFRMTCLSRRAADDPTIREVRSKNAKALWANPAYRAKVLEARGLVM